MVASESAKASRPGVYGGSFTISVKQTLVSQSVGSNTSKVRVTVEVSSSALASFSISSPREVRANGVSLLDTSSGLSLGPGSKVTIYDAIVTVAHDSTGAATSKASGQITNSVISGTLYVLCQFKLPRIPQLPDAPAGAPAASRTEFEMTVTSKTASGNGSPVTGYQIRRRSNVPTEWGDWVSRSGQVFEFTALPDRVYQFQSRAQTAAGWGPWSATKSVTIPPDTLTPPVGSVDVSVEPGVLTASWAAPPSTDDLIEYEARLNDGTWESMGLALTNVWWSLDPGTYTVGVRAVYGAGVSEVESSDPVVLAVLPDPVASVTVDEDGLASWAEPDDGGSPILSYQVEWWDGIEWVPADDVSQRASTFDGVILPGIGYRCRVRPVTGMGAAVSWTASAFVCLAGCPCTI